MIRCTNCNKELSPGNSFCTRCGTKIEKPAAAKASPVIMPEPEKKIKCISCGTELAPDLNFCLKCGTPIKKEAAPSRSPQQHSPTQYSPPPQTPQQRSSSQYPPHHQHSHAYTATSESNKKSFVPAIIAVAAVVVVVIVIGIVILLQSGVTSVKYEIVEGSVALGVYNQETVIIIPHGGEIIEKDGTFGGFGENSSLSLDGTTAAVLISDIDTYRFGGEGTSLYLVTDNVRFIADDVYYMLLSADGNAVIHLKDYDSETRTVELWLYSNGDNRRIARNMSVNHDFAISPDGSAIAFVTYQRGRYTGVIWRGEEIFEFGRDSSPVAVSNNAEYIYFFRNDILFVQKGIDSDHRERLGEDISHLHFNRDLSQVVFSSDGRTFISSGGNVREPLSGRLNYILTPDGTGAHSRWSFVTGIIKTIYGISNFTETFYVNMDGSVIFINRDFETSTIVRNLDIGFDVFLADDGRTITYLRRGSIFRVDGTANNATSEEIVTRDVERFVATADGRAVFFINDMNDVYFQRGMESPVRVSSNISDLWNFGLFNGDTVFFLSDGDVYYSSGERATLIRGIDGRATNVFASRPAVRIITSERDTELTFFSKDGIRFELIGRR